MIHTYVRTYVIERKTHAVHVAMGQSRNQEVVRVNMLSSDRPILSVRVCARGAYRSQRAVFRKVCMFNRRMRTKLQDYVTETDSTSEKVCLVE